MSSTSRVVKDEDLTLFTDLHKHRNSISNLLSDHEFDNPSHLYKTHSNKKLGYAGLDYLAHENDKRDYDWLKTPPATPLFPSIEMEAKAKQLCPQKETTPNLQPLSRFAVENRASTRSKGNKKPSHNFQINNKLPKPFPSGSNTAKATRITTSSRSTNKIAPSITCVPRNHINAISRPRPLVRSDQETVTEIRFSRETPIPNNLTTERRSASASRGVRSVPQPLFDALALSRTRPRGDNKTATSKGAPSVHENSSFYLNNNNKVLGSKMVEKVMNARKSLTTTSTTAATTTTTIKTNYYSCSKNTLLTTRSRAK